MYSSSTGAEYLGGTKADGGLSFWKTDIKPFKTRYAVLVYKSAADPVGHAEWSSLRVDTKQEEIGVGPESEIEASKECEDTLTWRRTVWHAMMV